MKKTTLVLCNNVVMTTVAGLAAENAKRLDTDYNKIGASIVRVCGEEHYAPSSGNHATVYLCHDNDMCYISDYKFKLVFGNGSGGGSQWTPVARNIRRGTNSWATIRAFQEEYPLGSALDVDGAFGCQCYDYANAFWYGQVNRGLVNGGDNARGVWTRGRDTNKGTEFTLVTNWADLKAGDWIVWGSGDFGHIAMAVSTPTGNTITCWNQNVSGYPWSTGGRVLSQDNMSNTGFLGAFRFTNWDTSNPIVA